MKGDIKSLQFDISFNKYVYLQALKVVETATYGQKIEPKFICNIKQYNIEAQKIC